MCYHHGCGHGRGYCHDYYDEPRYYDEPCWGPGPGRGYGRGRRYYEEPQTRDEVAGDLEDYKASLEAEIHRLERRIGALRQSPPASEPHSTRSSGT